MEQNFVNCQPNAVRRSLDVADISTHCDRVHAAQRALFSAEDLEHITRRLEAIKVAEDGKVAETCRKETDSNDSAVDDASLMDNETSSMITWGAHSAAQILSGAETADKYLQEAGDTYWTNVGKMQERFRDGLGESRELIAFKTSELSHLHEYRQQLLHLIRVVRRQLSKRESILKAGTQRSEQSQDRLLRNVDYLPRLEDQYYRLKCLTNVKQNELKELEEAEDVARSTHPRHAELAWSFCYTDTCATHRLSKERFGYWPMKKKAIFWDHQLSICEEIAY